MILDSDWEVGVGVVKQSHKCSISIYISISYSQNLDARNFVKLATVYVIKEMFYVTQDMN